MRLKGTLVDWKDDRGFGFIEPADGSARVFCHLKAFEVRVRRPISGDSLTYEVTKDAHGRLNASKVRPAGLEDAGYQSNIGPRRSPRVAKGAPAAQSKSATVGLVSTSIAVSIFLAGVIWLAVVERVPFFAPMIYIAMSGIATLAYAFDKSDAMNDRRRTPELTLHIIELLGGWPGAWIAQKLFRHKSRKVSYRVEFWLCAIVNVGALLWYARV
jgi:uncharacterized membrane protein YsdA (DUF1294 family)/cold shock CspA family protein